MSDKKVTDSHGVEIQAGDLVVSHNVVGIVKNINGWDSINVSYASERDVYAYEFGAPDEAYEYAPRIYNWNTRQYEKGEPETRYRKDMRVVGRKDIRLSQTRVGTHNITILRKADGSTPEALKNIIAQHELIFPSKDSGE